MSPLEGRVALVTGAARGQGRSHALALAHAGADVVLVDIAAQIESVDYPLATADDLAAAAEAVARLGVRSRAVPLDVRDHAGLADLVGRVEADWGSVDVLIANAGVCGFASMAELTHRKWTDMIDTNLTGVFNSVSAVLPGMRSRGFGRIVGVSSGAGRGGMRDLSHYSASKWGLIGFLKSVALEVGGDGVTANVVCPTSVATPMVFNEASLRRFRPDLPDPGVDDIRELFAGWSPLGTPWLEPEDVTRAVMYLVEDPGLTTGTVVEVNLGTSANRI